MRVLVSLMSVAVLAMPVATIASGALLEDNMDGNSGWTVNNGGDSSATFGYDYSADGIPEAPNPYGVPVGTATTGLKLTANDTAGAADAITAIRDLAALGHTAGENYTMSVDIWGNFNITGGSSGTTEFMGLSVGRDASSSSTNGASFVYTADGGSSRDYRMYKDFDEQRTFGEDPLEGLQYDEALDFFGNGNNGGLEPFLSQFPLLDPVVETGGLQVGNGPAGTDVSAGDAGFTWVTVGAAVCPICAGAAGTTADLGTVTFFITNNTNGVTTRIGQLDNSNGDSTLGTVEDNIGLLYADFFSSLNTSGFNFGIFDNVIRF